MMHRRAFSVETVICGAVTVIKPVGWLMDLNCGALDEQFRGALAGGCTRFVLDLSSAHFADNSGLKIFPVLKRELDARSGCMVLGCPNGSALRALAAGQVNKYLPVCDSVAEALDLLKQRTESGRWRAVTAG
jgi:anti-anti-sigma regulatory factor